MIHKATVVFFLSRIKGSLTAAVPLLIMTGFGAHLMLFTITNGLIVVRKHLRNLRKLLLYMYYPVISTRKLLMRENGINTNCTLAMTMFILFAFFIK